jgi:hypothetical protein
MKADRVSLHADESRMHSGPPWTLWRNGFCLAACLAERHVQGRKQGTTARHGTRVIVGHRLYFNNVRQIRQSFTRGTPQFVASAWVRIQGEADMIRQANQAELVENDPERTSASSNVALRQKGYSLKAALDFGWTPDALGYARPVDSDSD